MICVRFQPAHPHDRLLSHHYCLANCRVGSDAPLVALEPFRVREPYIAGDQTDDIDPPADAWHQVFNENGWIAGEERHIVCWRSGSAYRLDIAGVARFEISTGEPALIRVQPDHDARAALVQEALLGPAINLALAWRGVWCLHAGAALHHGQMVAFIGESGSGKSTLIAALTNIDRRAWQPGADDILPMIVSSAGLSALPRFPQFKLPPDAQPGRSTPECVPIQAIYLLAEADGVGPAEIHRLSPRASALALVRHTVASRLFDGPLLAAHLSAGMEAVRQLPVSRLVYPRRFDALPQVEEALTADLRAIEQFSESS